MRVSPRPLPSFAVDAMAALGGGAIAWTAAAAALRGALATHSTAMVAALASALVVGAAVRIGARLGPAKGHSPAVFVFAALAPIGTVAFVDGKSMAIALASIPALITAVACTIIVATAHSARAQGNLDAPERVAVTSGLGAACFSALLLPFLGWIVTPPLAVGVGLLALVIVREAIRARWLKRVHAGSEPGWSIVHEADLDTREAVPDATDHPLADAVLAYVSPTPDPYRAGRPHIVARVHAKPEALVRAPRIRLGKAVLALGAAATLSLAGAAAAARVDGHARHMAATNLHAPKCELARPYFQKQLEALPNVAWATLLTNAQDPSIAPGDGVILVMPREGALAESEILDVANSIPCNGKLALRLERPSVHPYTVTAKLTLEPGADHEEVRAEADRELRELVDVRSSTTLYDHASIGADDRTFGWRARWVLRHVPGVANATVLVDGQAEAPLGPRELPSIRAIELELGEKGEPL